MLTLKCVRETNLFPATTDIIVTDFTKVLLFVFTVDWISFAVDDCILSYDTVLGGVDFYDLELDSPHTSTYGEKITLSDRPVGFKEIWLEVDVKEGSRETFDSIGDGKNGYSLGILDIGTCVDSNDISQTNPDIGTNDTVDTSHSIIEIVICKNNKDSVLSFLSLDEDSVTAEKPECLHCI